MLHHKSACNLDDNESEIAFTNVERFAWSEECKYVLGVGVDNRLQHDEPNPYL